MAYNLWNMLLLAAMLHTATAFTSLCRPCSQKSPTANSRQQPDVIHQRLSFTALHAGFGGGDSSKKKKKEPKIKPKQQWDRYTSFKKEKPYRVAVKAVGKPSDEWLEVGNVKSKGGEYTDAAVARQRALIADVS